MNIANAGTVGCTSGELALLHNAFKSSVAGARMFAMDSAFCSTSSPFVPIFGAVTKA